MRHTREALLMLGLLATCVALLVGWIVFTYWISSGSYWGLALALAPFPVSVLGRAMWKDIHP